jgi:hypothetical protein
VAKKREGVAAHKSLDPSWRKTFTGFRRVFRTSHGKLWPPRMLVNDPIHEITQPKCSGHEPSDRECCDATGRQSLLSPRPIIITPTRTASKNEHLYKRVALWPTYVGTK